MNHLRLSFVVGLLFALGAAGCSKGKDGDAQEPPVSQPTLDAEVEVAPSMGCLKLASDPGYGADHACTCATDCASGNCYMGACCNRASCATGRATGMACDTGADCESTFCVDGVCCENACTGACKACNLPLTKGDCMDIDDGKPDPHNRCKKDAASSCGFNGLCNGDGACGRYGEETVCKPESCTGTTTYNPPSTCDGQGKCLPQPPELCDPSQCQNNRCVLICTADTQCAVGKACLNGSCGDMPNGANCTTDDDCISTICAGGICCATACDGECMTCGANGKRGMCVPAPAGSADPLCTAEEPESCGTTGKCDGAGACAVYGSNTVCRAAAAGMPAAHCTAGACPGDMP